MGEGVRSGRSLLDPVVIVEVGVVVGEFGPLPPLDPELEPLVGEELGVPLDLSVGARVLLKVGISSEVLVGLIGGISDEGDD